MNISMNTQMNIPMNTSNILQGNCPETIAKKHEQMKNLM